MLLLDYIKINSLLEEESVKFNLYQYGWHRYDPCSSYPQTIRPHYVLHIVHEGCGCYIYKNHKYFLNKGDIFLIPPAQTVQYFPDKLTSWELVWIMFDGEATEELLKSLGLSAEQVIGHLKNHEEVSKTVFDMIENYNIDGANKYYLYGKMYEFFSLITRNIVKVGRVKNINADKRIAEIIEYITKNYKELTITDICKNIGIERTTLYKEFKKIYNMSPQEYVINYKLEVARELVEETVLPLKEIVFLAGFSDYSNFFKAFNKKFNISAKELRLAVNPKINNI